MCMSAILSAFLAARASHHTGEELDAIGVCVHLVLTCSEGAWGPCRQPGLRLRTCRGALFCSACDLGRTPAALGLQALILPGSPCPEFELSLAWLFQSLLHL